jgi:hypothetical protein
MTVALTPSRETGQFIGRWRQGRITSPYQAPTTVDPKERDMNAGNIPKTPASLSITVLTLCGAWVLAPSCAARPAVDPGGSGGKTGSGGSGGSGSGGSNSGGAGGNGAGGSSVTITDDEVRFDGGMASGPIDGKAFVTLGIKDDLTDPVCDNSGSSDPIKGDEPCQGTTKWNDVASLCISGSIPIVEDNKYKENFGLQIVVNSSEPAYSDSEGHTLDKSYTNVTFHYDQGSITPALGTSLLRALIHRGGDDDESVYCAIVTSSGEAIEITSFNSECWPGGHGVDFAADDIPKIDKVGIQISSDDKKAYEVDNFCLQRIVFRN